MAQQDSPVSREKLERLSKSKEAARLMELLDRQGQVQTAAQAAAQGDTAPLMKMLRAVMDSPEGAKLTQRIREQAEQ